MRVLVSFDTLNIAGGTMVAGASARTFSLNRELSRLADVEVRFLLGDVGSHDAGWQAWPFPSWIVPFDTIYDRPDVVRSIVEPFRPDLLVMLTGHEILRWGRKVATDLGARLVYEVHDDEARVFASVGGSAEDTAEAELAQRMSLQQADGVVTFTPRERELALRCGVPEYRLATVPMGVPVDERTVWGPATDALTLLFVGNLYYEPNMRALSALCETILPEVRATEVDARLRVIGRCPAQAQRKYESASVRFLGLVDDLDMAIAGASIGLAPVTAGSGMKSKVLDYLAAGLPVVCTTEATHGMSKEIQDLLVIEDDIAHFSDRILTLWRNTATLRDIGIGGRVAVSAEFAWRTLARHANRFYRSVLDIEPVGGDLDVLSNPEVVAAVERRPFWWRELEAKEAWPYPMVSSASRYLTLNSGQLTEKGFRG